VKTHTLRSIFPTGLLRDRLDELEPGEVPPKHLRPQCCECGKRLRPEILYSSKPKVWTGRWHGPSPFCTKKCAVIWAQTEMMRRAAEREVQA